MTGYGRAELETEEYNIIAEIKSVNHKYKKIYLHTSDKLSILEPKINEILKKGIGRGRVNYSLEIKSKVEQEVKVEVKENIVKEYIDSIKKLQNKFALAGELNVDLLLQFPEVLRVEEIEENVEKLWPSIKHATEKALDKLTEMRRKEGEQLFSDFIHRLDKIEEIINGVEIRIPDMVAEYKSKLKDRIDELLADSEIAEDRLVSEVAIIADKSDVTEEIVRVKSHLEQFKETLNLETEKSVGRKLDFIAQEMHREINTIGSKVNDSEVSNYIIDLKSEVDKIREQVQNIE
jgi:uncharacterized protein (TIGR00255 family)